MFRRVLPRSRNKGAGVTIWAATATLAGVLNQASSVVGRACPCKRKPWIPRDLNSGPASVVPSSGSPKVGENDMAICSGKGQPTEAVRTLFERAEGGDYQLFVFHDADLDGYDIARVMAEETRRMPGYSVDVVDIGLTVEDALEMGLASEPFYRKKDISWELRMKLSGTAKEHLYQRNGYSKGISGKRFELNAILPDTRRVEYIERKLEENGVRGKVIPPDEMLAELVGEKYRTLSAGWVAKTIEDLICSEELGKEIADQFLDEFNLDEARRHIEARFDKDRSLSWRTALKKRLEEVQEKHADAFKDAVWSRS
jgi:GNAT superfamily N-acetyltransferase